MVDDFNDFIIEKCAKKVTSYTNDNTELLNEISGYNENFM